MFEERKDWTILNFAVIGNETRYHSPGDTIWPRSIRDSVRHMGEQALAAARTLAVGRARAPAGNRLYADMAGRLPGRFPCRLSASPCSRLLVPLFAWLA